MRRYSLRLLRRLSTAPVALVAAVALLLAIAGPGAAMADGLRVGVRAGLLTSNLIGGQDDFDRDTDTRLGWTAGLVGQYDIAPAFSLRGGLSWASRGFRYQPILIGSGGDPGERLREFDPTVDVDFIDLSIDAVTRLNLSSDVSIYAFVGPTLGVLVNLEFATIDSLGEPDRVDVTDEFNRLALQGVVGVGAQWRIDRTTLALDLAYRRDLMGLEQEAPPGADGLTVELHALQASLSARFDWPAPGDSAP